MRGLKNRHIQMIALGGAIGTGLFYGSATSIGMAGPAITVAYLVGGAVIFLIIGMTLPTSFSNLLRKSRRGPNTSFQMGLHSATRTAPTAITSDCNGRMQGPGPGVTSLSRFLFRMICPMYHYREP